MTNNYIEIVYNIILDNSKTEDFIEDNKRWLCINMLYFSYDFARKSFIND